MVKRKRKYVKSGLYKKGNFKKNSLLKQSNLYKSINLEMYKEDNERRKLELEKEKQERQLILKETAIIISGILGIILLIGVFWGKIGLISVGVGLFLVILGVIFALSVLDKLWIQNDNKKIWKRY